MMAQISKQVNNATRVFGKLVNFQQERDTNSDSALDAPRPMAGLLLRGPRACGVACGVLTYSRGAVAPALRATAHVPPVRALFSPGLLRVGPWGLHANGGHGASPVLATLPVALSCRAAHTGALALPYRPALARVLFSVVVCVAPLFAWHFVAVALVLFIYIIRFPTHSFPILYSFICLSFVILILFFFSFVGFLFFFLLLLLLLLLLPLFLLFLFFFFFQSCATRWPSATWRSGR